MKRQVDVAIIGAGTAGLNALAQVRRAGKSFVLIDGGPLGTTCARVGCMPSKAFIQIGDDFHRRNLFARKGIEGQAALRLDQPQALEHVRELRDIFVDRVLAGSTDHLGDELIQGYAEFVAPTVLKVNDAQIHAECIVIATGSRPVVPQSWQRFGERVLTTDSFFEQEGFPTRMAVIGLGIIGLELGQALHRYGVEVTGLDQTYALAHLSDPVVNETAVEILGKEFPIWLGEAAQIAEEGDQLRITAGERSVQVDKVLVAMGRRCYLEGLKLDQLGVALDERGIPVYNPQTMQVGDLPIFIAGDVTGDRPILHEAADEGRIAGFNAVHEVAAFQRKTPLAITFCSPNIATVGIPWSALSHRTDVAVGAMRLGPLGRALIMGENKGILRVYAEKTGGKVLGAALVAPRGENLAHLLAWSIQLGLTVFDMLNLPFYHPVIEEGLQAALVDLANRIDGDPGPLRELAMAR